MSDYDKAKEDYEYWRQEEKEVEQLLYEIRESKKRAQSNLQAHCLHTWEGWGSHEKICSTCGLVTGN